MFTFLINLDLNYDIKEQTPIYLNDRHRRNRKRSV